MCRPHRDQLQEHVDASDLLGAGDALLLCMGVLQREPRQLSKDGHRMLLDGTPKHRLLESE